MKVCEHAVNYVQTVGYEGKLRVCGWMYSSMIGKLSEQSFYDIYHGKKARALWESLGRGEYSSLCNFDSCSYLPRGVLKDHLMDIEDIPEYPHTLALAHEDICNYTCPFCSSRPGWDRVPQSVREAGYENIYEKLKPVMPHIKNISAHGRGELFCARHILRTLAEWRPLAPVEECSVGLETNGSLFDAEHWKQIENLGQYKLRVAITVGSFDEYTYRLLSGTNLPVQQIIDNLHFVRSLREKGIVNHFEIATVVQERNFYQMPEFTRRCIEEFGADTVRLRPYSPSIHHIADSVWRWFTDVRSINHPYHEEFKKVMQDPIFKHPKFFSWSGNADSLTPDLLTFLVRSEKMRAIKVITREILKWPFMKAKRLLHRLRFGI